MTSLLFIMAPYCKVLPHFLSFLVQSPLLCLHIYFVIIHLLSAKVWPHSYKRVSLIAYCSVRYCMCVCGGACEFTFVHKLGVCVSVCMCARVRVGGRKGQRHQWLVKQNPAEVEPCGTLLRPFSVSSSAMSIQPSHTLYLQPIPLSLTGLSTASPFSLSL